MNLLLDEGLAMASAELLREFGHDAVHVFHVGLGGASDDQIMAEALRRSAVIATRDTDFHQMLAISGAARPSVILLRIEGLNYVRPLNTSGGRLI
ncbi:MAG: hypothetical protein GC162_18680 [Planctomycetes bacterium]|nr:hypothetical protein [Planctomycetota bacterium]